MPTQSAINGRCPLRQLCGALEQLRESVCLGFHCQSHGDWHTARMKRASVLPQVLEKLTPLVAAAWRESGTLEIPHAEAQAVLKRLEDVIVRAQRIQSVPPYEGPLSHSEYSKIRFDDADPSSDAITAAFDYAKQHEKEDEAELDLSKWLKELTVSKAEVERWALRWEGKFTTKSPPRPGLLPQGEDPNPFLALIQFAMEADELATQDAASHLDHQATRSDYTLHVAQQANDQLLNLVKNARQAADRLGIPMAEADRRLEPLEEVARSYIFWRFKVVSQLVKVEKGYASPSGDYIVSQYQELCKALPAVRALADRWRGEPASASPSGPLRETTVPPGKLDAMTWQEAADRLERLRNAGERWTSQQKMAVALGCSPATINRAIKETPSLQQWSTRPRKSAKATSLNAMVLDQAPEKKTLDPADEAAIREYLERDLRPDERAFFNGLSPEDQLEFLDDPDRHTKLLGRTA